MERSSASLVSSSSPRSPAASNKSPSLPRARHSQSPQLNDTGFSSHRQSSSPLPQSLQRQASRSSTTLTRASTATPRAAIPGRFTEEWDASQRGSSIIDDSYRVNMSDMQRSASVHSYAAGDDNQLPLRNNTLKKKSSMRRTASLGRSSSRRSNRPGSVRSFAVHSNSEADEVHSAFYCPVPTSGTPTDILANRFQVWRKILKDLITYFREIQSHYEARSKSLVKLANVANNVNMPPQFLKSAGIDDALQFLRNYNKAAIQEANKARDIEEDVILALTGLRSDLQQKIKEIKHLSGDFKNSVDREMDSTSKAVRSLADVLDKSEAHSSGSTGKQDPFLMRLAVDRQVERQIDEENYLHQAYLNLEGSGRELESIVVGEIQKAYNAYAGILKREADNGYAVVEELRDGPISMPKDQEWIHFVTHDNQIVDPTIPMRSSDQIHYPGQDHYAAQEIRAGLLERKSKYLKSYAAGWYVLSTTHLHEFKSADKAAAPVMSLYLPEQKLGSHSTEGGSSNKFILKGRQTGAMHRGHTWVFRAESHDTMMAWYEDIKALTEKSPEERHQFVRTHSRSMSRGSRRSMSSDGIVDEDDDEPFSANQVEVNTERRDDSSSRRPQAGGRFPSDLQVNAQRGLQAPQSPSSVSSGNHDGHPDAQMYSAAGVAAAPALAAEEQDQDNRMGYGGTVQTPMENMPSQAAIASQQGHHDGINPYTSEPVSQSDHKESTYFAGAVAHTESEQPRTELPGAEGSDNLEKKQAASASDSNASGTNQNYINGSAVGDATKSVEDSVPRSEGPKDMKPLELVPESEPTAHTTEPGTVGDSSRIGRKSDDRTNSMATISNLPIPGQFPKNTGVASS